MKTILSDLHIRIVGAFRTRLEPGDWDRAEECDPFARLYVVNKGRATTMVDGTLRTFEPGTLYIIPSHTTFQHYDSPGFDHYWLHFQATMPSGLSLFEILDCDWEMDLSLIPEAADYAKRIVDLYDSHSFLDIIESRSLFTNLFCQFLRQSTMTWKTPLKEIKRFEHILRYIEDNISEPITVDDLAEKCNLQPQYFSKVFSSCFGMPPVRFINQKRMEQAQFYLVNSMAPVKEIALKLGYEDECYFSRTFKRIVNLSPSQYRAKNTILRYQECLFNNR